MTKGGEDTDRAREFGRLLRRLRKEKGLSQVEAASRAGMSDRHWKRLEAGTSPPTRRILAEAARALGVDARALFERVGFAPPLASHLELEPKFKPSLFADMYRKYQSLTPKQRRELRLTLKMLDHQLDRMLADRDE